VDKRSIGSLAVSVVGLGCNNFGPRVDAETTREVVHAALDAGVNFFDTADIYGKGQSEEYVGRALGPRRGEVVLASKFGMKMDEQLHGAHPDYIRQAVEDSLRRLGTDRIDLYQLHTPDPTVPVADTLGALDELVRAGKVIEIGCSNFSVDQLREARDAAPGAPFQSVQNEYSLFRRDPEEGVLDECRRQGLAFIPYFPLASGLLTGKYRRGTPPPQGTRITAGGRYADLLSDENLERVERLAQWAEAHGHTLLELAFAWLLARGEVVSVIAGATSAAQVRSNAAASAWRMTGAERAEVDALAE
jgi:aryl-alcohol dehydrogenase-like predicted oxidoreductase